MQLAAQNRSGISGTATLSDTDGGKTRVVVNITGAAGGNEPAHIHQGTCATRNSAPKYLLTNVQNGASTAAVDDGWLTSRVETRYTEARTQVRVPDERANRND